MSTQWNGLLKNVGEWIGSFTEFSAEGECLKDTPSHLTLALSPDAHRIDLTLRRFPKDQPENLMEFQFAYPGPGLAIPFLEQGAFSQGALQHSGFARFGAELSLIGGDRRLRLVPLYSDGLNFSSATLIRETRADVTASPPLKSQALCGNWQGTATTLFADGRESQTYDLSLAVEQQGNQLHQQLQFLDQTIQTSGQLTSQYIEFLSGQQPMRLLLLPGGGSCLCPNTIQRGAPFFLEAGWLMEPTKRQRLIRNYNEKGEWVSLTLVQEHKVTESESKSDRIAV